MSDFVKELNAADFDAETAAGLVVTDFWVPWRKPCRMLAPIFAAVMALTSFAAIEPFRIFNSPADNELFYHNPGDVINGITAICANPDGSGNSIAPSNVTWSVVNSPCCWVSPTTGLNTSLNVGQHPPESYITVRASITDVSEDVSWPTNGTFALRDYHRCRPTELNTRFTDSGTQVSNFTPLPESTPIGIEIKIPGCDHYGNEDGFIQVVARRKTVHGWEDVAWIMDTTSTRDLPRYSFTTNWNGKTHSSRAAVEVDGYTSNGISNVFQFPGHPEFNRMLPNLVSGDFVRDPFVSIFVRFYKEDPFIGPHITPEDEIELIMYIKGIINVVVDDDVIEAMSQKTESKYPVSSYRRTPVIFPGFGGMQNARNEFEDMPNIIKGILPNMNVHITFNRNDLSSRVKTVDFVIGIDENNEKKEGFWNGTNSRNVNPGGECVIYPEAMLRNIDYYYIKNKPRESGKRISVPITGTQYKLKIGIVSSHELAHGHGLKDPNFSDTAYELGVAGGEVLMFEGRPFLFPGWHNNCSDGDHIMDVVGLTDVHIFNNPQKKSPVEFWMEINLRYLEWISPIPQ